MFYRLKLKLLFSLLWLGLGILFFAQESLATTINSASCSQASVQAAVNNATTADTVTIPSGSCTWNAPLSITNNINLKGAGAKNTIITSGGTTLIEYVPSLPSASVSFELSDMTLNMNGGESRVATFTNHTGSIMQQLKIHDLVVNNAYIAFDFYGIFKGVIYNNTITTSSTLQQNVGGADGQSGLTEWNTIQKCSGNPLFCSHDDGRNLYWEDNTLNIGSTILESGGAGFSWVARYNTIHFNTTSPAFEWHGNYPLPNNRCSSMDMAIYGNNLIRDSLEYHPYTQPRGGMGMIFYNKVTAANNYSLFYVEWRDEAAPSEGACSATTNLQPQDIFDSYEWANFSANHSLATCQELDQTGNLAENTNYFCQQPGIFDGSGSSKAAGQASDRGGGVGCGPIENRPANCATGVGYFVPSNITAIPCDGLGNNFGVDPNVPITGTLYKCTAPNTWTAYYQPYTYPHPLRVGESTTPLPDTTPPSPPSGLTILAMIIQLTNGVKTPIILGVGGAGILLLLAIFLIKRFGKE